MKRSPFGWFSQPWLVGSVAALVFVIPAVLLWSPWESHGIAGGTKLRLYCAAGMIKPVEEILNRYEKEYGVRIEPTFDGAGKLLNTIRVVGGGDLFLCSDTLALEEARKHGLIAEVIPIAVLRPVLVVNQRTQERLKSEGKPVAGINDLLRDDLKIVLGNPEMTAVGRAGERALPAKVRDALRERQKLHTPRVSTVSTVMEVADAVRFNDNSVGIVWDATARQFGELAIVTPPEFLTKEASDQAVLAVLKKTEQTRAALQFARFVTARDRGMESFKKHHFEPVEEADDWQETPGIQLSAGAMLQPAVDQAIRAFGEREGVKITTVYAGCGQLVATMEGLKRGNSKGAFPDAYFSCDQTFLDMVQPWFRPGVQVASNDMVLIVPKGNPAGVNSLLDLRKDVRIGLAHPVNSALGKLTDDLLKKQPGLHETLYNKGRKPAVTHSDAAHTLVNQMRAGALDAAIVYRSNVLSAAEVTRVHLEVIELGLPEAKAVQPFAIAKETRHPQLMRRLQDALTNAEQEANFKGLGFQWLYSK